MLIEYIIVITHSSERIFNPMVVVDVNNHKNGRTSVKLKKASLQQDALGKVNRVKEIRRRGEDGLYVD